MNCKPVYIYVYMNVVNVQKLQFVAILLCTFGAVSEVAINVKLE